MGDTDDNELNMGDSAVDMGDVAADTCDEDKSDIDQLNFVFEKDDDGSDEILCRFSF